MEQEQHKKKSLKKKKNKSRKKSQSKKQRSSDGKVYHKKRSQKKSRKKNNNITTITTTTKKKSKKMRGDGGYEDGVVTRKRTYEETIFDYIKNNRKKPLDEGIFRQKMEKEENIQTTDDEGNTVLNLLLQDKERARSSGAIIKYLLEKGVDPNIKNEKRLNALIYSIRYISDDVDTLSQIISKSETNTIYREKIRKDDENEPIYREHSLTIMMECFRCFNLEALKLILKKHTTKPYSINIYLTEETDPGYTNNEEIGTLLMYIVRNYENRMDSLLIELLNPEYGVDMSMKNKTTGLTAFLMALGSQRIDALHLCSLLLEHSHGRIDVNERVIDVSKTEIKLIKKHFDIKIYVKKNNIHERILVEEKIFYTCALKLIFNRMMNNRVELLRLLLNHNVDVNAFFSEETYKRTLGHNEEFWKSKIVVYEEIIEEETVSIEKIVVTEKELSENSIEERTTTNTSPLCLWRMGRYYEKEDLDFLKLLLSKDDVNVNNLFCYAGNVESNFLKIQLDLDTTFFSSYVDDELILLRDEVLRLIIEKSTITSQFYLLKAVQKGYKSFGNLLLQKNNGTSINDYKDFNIIYFFGSFVNLHWANNEEMMEEDSMIQNLLRNKPEEINKYVKESSILFSMMNNNRFNIFETLLRRNESEINTRDKDEKNRTLLMKAVENNLGNHVRLLLKLGANPNIRDKLGRTALFYISPIRSSRGGDEDFLDLLCEVTDVNIRDNDNNTALMYILETKWGLDFNYFVNIILKNKTFDIDKVNNEGDTALFFLLKKMLLFRRTKLPEEFIDMMNYYLEKVDTLKINHRDRKGENLLSLLDDERLYDIYEEESDRELLKKFKEKLLKKVEEVLLREKADIWNIRDVYGRTELMNIAREKYVSPSVFQKLIENLTEDELNAVDNYGNTALMYSLVTKNYKEGEEKRKKTISYYESLSYTEMLMEKRANDEIRNIEGETMYDIAERLTNGESMEEIYGSNEEENLEENPEKNWALYLYNRERGK